MSENWMLAGTVQDEQSITADWTPSQLELIHGVAIKEIKNVPKANGYLTEVYRSEWQLDDLPVSQVFQVALVPGGISAWHAHRVTTDRLFVNQGMMRIVLYDSRADSPTRGVVNEVRFGAMRPALVIVPPQVWHGIQNLSQETSLILNLVDRAYRYESPDHWRVPPDSPEIPYQFK
jgi:dTDP-4-dehydrorhamnose 3,5-epimerase